jgi:hypothetical protein
MDGSAVTALPRAPRYPLRMLAASVVFALAAAVAIYASTRTDSTASPVKIVGVAVGVVTGAWMFISEKPEKPLVVFLLYLGLLDGYLKLRTNSNIITLGRDALLYAIAVGLLARAMIRRQPLHLPPLSGWVLAFVAVVLAQLANPNNIGTQHTIGALRPHLEFIPLFFIGYAIMQSAARLRAFLLVMLIVAAGNGIVGVIQLNLTPQQLSSWGPGYRDRISGKGTGVRQVSARVYGVKQGDNKSKTRTRPFGLGSDSGVGAAWGMLGLGAALALVTLAARRNEGRIGLLLCAGPPMAIISGQGRSLLIASIIALLAYAAAATTARRLLPTLAGLILGVAVIVGVVSYVASSSGTGVFDRYKTLSPGKIKGTTSQDRGKSINRIPKFFVKHPLGYQLGAVGPAAGFAGGGTRGVSDGETEPTFLLSELGIPGFLVILGFHLHLLWLGVTRIRRLDGEERIFVAALLSGLVGMFATWLSAATTANSPFSPYLWFAGGALSYWLTKGVARERRPSAVARTTAEPVAVSTAGAG